MVQQNNCRLIILRSSNFLLPMVAGGHAYKALVMGSLLQVNFGQGPCMPLILTLKVHIPNM